MAHRALALLGVFLLAACSDETAAPANSVGGDAAASGGQGGGGGANGGSGASGAAASGGVSNSSGGSAPSNGGHMSANGGSGGASGGMGGTNTAGDGGTGTGGSGGSSGSGGSQQAPAVRIVGRTDGNASPSFEWSGVSIQARFRGTSASIDLDGGNNNYFELIVDGQVKPKVATSAGRATIDLVSGLTDTEHDLVLWRRTEADDYAPSQFFGLDFGGGALLSMPVPAHKIEVVGDSITCGYGNEGAGPNCGFTFDTENNYLAYGSVAARAVDADVYTECWSGKGVYRNRDGSTDTVPTLFDKAIPTDGSSTWDFAWKPDAIVVNLGTNDFAMGDPGQPFVTAYEAFVATIRTHYPSAYVFLMIGPMTGGNDLTTTRGYLDQVVQARKSGGDDRIEQVLIDPQDGNQNGLGCDYHPSVKTHDIVGQTLAAAMKSALGW